MSEQDRIEAWLEGDEEILVTDSESVVTDSKTRIQTTRRNYAYGTELVTKKRVTEQSTDRIPVALTDCRLVRLGDATRLKPPELKHQTFFVHEGVDHAIPLSDLRKLELTSAKSGDRIRIHVDVVPWLGRRVRVSTSVDDPKAPEARALQSLEKRWKDGGFPLSDERRAALGERADRLKELRVEIVSAVNATRRRWTAWIAGGVALLAALPGLLLAFPTLMIFLDVLGDLFDGRFSNLPPFLGFLFVDLLFWAVALASLGFLAWKILTLRSAVERLGELEDELTGLLDPRTLPGSPAELGREGRVTGCDSGSDLAAPTACSP